MQARHESSTQRKGLRISTALNDTDILPDRKNRLRTAKHAQTTKGTLQFDFKNRDKPQRDDEVSSALHPPKTARQRPDAENLLVASRQLLNLNSFSQSRSINNLLSARLSSRPPGTADLHKLTQTLRSSREPSPKTQRELRESSKGAKL